MDKNQFRTFMITMIVTVFVTIGLSMIASCYLTYQMIKEDARKAAVATKDKASDLKEKGIEAAKDFIEKHQKKE